MNPPCIILAGGLGTRLKSAVPDLPKCLAPVAGRPFLEWQLRSLTKRGITNFVLSLGHGAEMVISFLERNNHLNLRITFVIENELLGTGGATFYAMNEFDLNEAFIANGDTFLGGPLDKMFRKNDLDNGELMRLATVDVEDRTRFGGVMLKDSKKVSHFLEKGSSGPGSINAGLYRIHGKAFSTINRKVFSLEKDLMPLLIPKGALQAQKLQGPFIDIGIPDDYYKLCNNVEHYVG